MHPDLWIAGIKSIGSTHHSDGEKRNSGYKPKSTLVGMWNNHKQAQFKSHPQPMLGPGIFSISCNLTVVRGRGDILQAHLDWVLAFQDNRMWDYMGVPQCHLGHLKFLMHYISMC